MELFSNQYVQIILSSLAVYLFVVVAIRIFGKKELSQLSVIDLVFVLLISNSVQNAMVGSNTTLTGGLVAAASLFAVNYLFKLISYRYPKFGTLIQGEALMLIYNGTLLKNNIRKAKITEDEIAEALREHGVGSVSEVNLAILEVDGNISVLSDDFRQKTVNKRKTKQTVHQKFSEKQ